MKHELIARTRRSRILPTKHFIPEYIEKKYIKVCVFIRIFWTTSLGSTGRLAPQGRSQGLFISHVGNPVEKFIRPIDTDDKNFSRIYRIRREEKKGKCSSLLIHKPIECISQSVWPTDLSCYYMIVSKQTNKILFNIEREITKSIYLDSWYFNFDRILRGKANIRALEILRKMFDGRR